MLENDILDASYVKSILDYNFLTGEFFWKARSPDMFKKGKLSQDNICSRWNNRHAGKKTGNRHVNGFIYLIINSRKYMAHRIAWLYFYGEMPKLEIDHIDGNNSNNIISNLRQATRSENERNKGISSRNTSKFKGVCWNKNRSKWESYITVNRKQIYLGLFSDIDDAVFAYKEASKKYHGKFARAL